MACREAFQEAVMSGTRCERLTELAPDCGCEAGSVSPYSPGPVSREETLARLIYSPHHIDRETGEVTEAAFSDVKDKGLSVQREAHAEPAEIRAIGERKLADDIAKGKVDRKFLGIVVAQVQALQTVTYDGGKRALCVYDSALPDQQAHADVCQTAAPPSAMKRARKKLRDLFGRKPQTL
jgi:hypothetical protein